MSHRKNPIPTPVRGRPAQKGAGRHVSVQKRLGGFRRIGLHETAVAVGQVQHEVVHLALHTADDRHRLAEITLGVARRMVQRHEHLLSSPPTLPDVILDYGVLTVETVLAPHRLKMRLAVCRCFLGTLVSPSRMASITPVKGSS